MKATSELHRFVRFVNTLLFATALAVLVDQSVAAAVGRFDQLVHWRSEDRSLQVVDKTGDKAWNEATRHAVEVWNRAATGTGLQITWTAGTGRCEPRGTKIEVCQEPYQTLSPEELPEQSEDREGLADLRLGSDRGQAHISGVRVIVCSNCGLETPRRRVIAAHEVGHALGLDHSPRRGSILFPRGGPDAPDTQDVASLVALYAHSDDADRCGALNLQVGPICI